MKNLIEFSLHGKAYYAVYSFPCPCEYRQHGCKGNELSDEEIAEAVRLGPAREDFIHSDDTLEAFKERYKAYLTASTLAKTYSATSAGKTTTPDSQSTHN